MFKIFFDTPWGEESLLKRAAKTRKQADMYGRIQQDKSGAFGWVYKPEKTVEVRRA